MRVLFSTGELSGAVIAAVLRQELAESQPGVEVRRLDWSQSPGPVFGFCAGLRAAPKVGRVVARALAEAAEFRPNVAVLVSYSGLHLRLGRKLRALGIPVAYVAPPQVWAWGACRISALRAAADRVVCLFSFEKELLARAGVRADYFGYPLLDSVSAGMAGCDVRRSLGFGTQPYVAFLPGSRPAEVRHHLPLFYRVFELLLHRFPSLAGVIVGPSVVTALSPSALHSPPLTPHSPPFTASPSSLSLAERYRVMAGAACLVTVSGTATAEAAILGVPMVVCYHLSLPSAVLARLLLRTRYFALPNILAGRQIVPELLNPSPERLAAETTEFLTDRALCAALRGEFRVIRALLGPAGAARQIARLVLELGRG